MLSEEPSAHPAEQILMIMFIGTCFIAFTIRRLTQMLHNLWVIADILVPLHFFKLSLWTKSTASFTPGPPQSCPRLELLVWQICTSLLLPSVFSNFHSAWGMAKKENTRERLLLEITLWKQATNPAISRHMCLASTPIVFCLIKKPVTFETTKSTSDKKWQVKSWGAGLYGKQIPLLQG